MQGFRLKHDGTYNSGGYVRQGVTPVDDLRKSPGTYHPLVCTHPETGRRMLYLGRRRNAYVENLDLAASESLLGELWSYTEQVELTWHNVWRVGDLVLWDNRCTMHRRDAFDPAARRIMHRTQIKGQTRPSVVNSNTIQASGHAESRFQGARLANRILVVLCLMYLLLYVDRVNIATVAPQMTADLKLTHAGFGLRFLPSRIPMHCFSLSADGLATVWGRAVH